MSKSAIALIITWVVIGLLIAGGIGFFIGKRGLKKPDQQIPQGQQPGQQLPTQQQGQKQPLPSGNPQQQQPAGQQPPGQQQPAPQ